MDEECPINPIVVIRSVAAGCPEEPLGPCMFDICSSMSYLHSMRLDPESYINHARCILGPGGVLFSVG